MSTTTALMLGATNHGKEDREENDFYATHPEAIKSLLNTLKHDGIELNKNIWECACGMGHLSEELKKAGHDVFSTDLIDRGYEYLNERTDFLKDNIKFVFKKYQGDILTNPPFKLAEEFAEKGIEYLENGNKLLLFLKIQFLESEKRRKLFQKYPPKYIYVHSSRQICAKNGDFEKYTSATLCYAWYIWEKGYNGETILRWIK